MDHNTLQAVAQNTPIHPGASRVVLIYALILALLVMVIGLARVSANRRTPDDDDVDF